MIWQTTKVLLTSLIIVLIGYVSKRSVIMAGMLAALPSVTILSMIWMNVEGIELQKINEFSRSVFWMVLPSLPALYFFPNLSSKWGFNIALVISSLATSAMYLLMAAVLSKWSIKI